MAYGTQTQVQAYLAAVQMNAITTPNATQIATMLADRAGEIDSALSAHGFAVPVTAPAWFVTELGVLNAKGAAADVIQQAAPAFVEGVQILNPFGKQLHDDYLARLKDIRLGIGIPVGVARAETQQSPSGFFVDSGAWGQDLQAVDAFGDLIKSKPAFRRGVAL